MVFLPQLDIASLIGRRVICEPDSQLCLNSSTVISRPTSTRPGCRGSTAGNHVARYALSLTKKKPLSCCRIAADGAFRGRSIQRYQCCKGVEFLRRQVERPASLRREHLCGSSPASAEQNGPPSPRFSCEPRGFVRTTGISAMAAGARLRIYFCAFRQIWRRCWRSLPEHRRPPKASATIKDLAIPHADAWWRKHAGFALIGAFINPRYPPYSRMTKSDRKGIALRATMSLLRDLVRSGTRCASFHP